MSAPIKVQTLIDPSWPEYLYGDDSSKKKILQLQRVCTTAKEGISLSVLELKVLS